MSAFCDNKVDCRRSLQLKYFGENFSREECLKDKKTACDNCLGKVTFMKKIWNVLFSLNIFLSTG